MNKKFFIVLLLLINIQGNSMIGQALREQITEKVPLNKSIMYGQLQNGLTYYLKNLPDSKEKINMRFYVKAGSKHQDSDQINIAHFLEHMAFKSSENFPLGILNDKERLEKIDVSRADLNGNAGPDYTGYSFKVDYKNERALETGLLWFKDIATGLKLKDEEINAERGVLIQEFVIRSGDNIAKSIARSELKSQLVPCAPNHSSLIEHHKSFDSNRLRQFYTDWYRPDLMTLVIVGKIDNMDSLRSQIKARFSDIPAQAQPRQVVDCDTMFFNRPPQFAAVHEEIGSTQSINSVKMELFFRDPTTKNMSSQIEGLQRLIKNNLLIEIINERFREKTNVYNGRYGMRMAHSLKTSKAPSSFFITINSENNTEERALKETSYVLRQLSKHGVLEREFRIAKERQLADLTGINHYKIIYWLEEIEKHLIYGEALPANKTRIVKDWVSQYSLEEFQDFIKDLDFEKPDDIGILAPSGHEATSFTEDQVRSWLKSVEDEPIPVYSLPSAPKSLMTPSEVVELEEKDYVNKGVTEAGVRELILENGLKVVLKSFEPTPGPYQKKVMLHGFIDRGALSISEKDYFSAINAPEFIKNSGVASFDKFELQRYLSNSSLTWGGINIYVNNQEAGIKVDADLEDFEELLQVVNLFLTEPRLNTEAFIDWKHQDKLIYKYQFGDLKHTDLIAKIQKITGNHSEVARGSERYAGLEKTDKNKGYVAYKELFGNVQDFTFIITGDFPLNSVIPLANKYLGNLPSRQTNKTPEMLNGYTKLPSGPILVEFYTPEAYNKTNYLYKPLYIIPNRGSFNWKEIIKTEALGYVLNTKVQNLRYTKAYALYSVNGFGVFNNAMKQYEIGAQFHSSPEEYPELRKEFRNLVSQLKKELVSEDFLKFSISRMNLIYNPFGRANSHFTVQDKLYSHYRYSVPWIDSKEVVKFIDSITSEDILMAARKYLKDDYLFEFVMKDRN